MKKVLLLLTILISITTFTSCSSNKNNDQSISYSICPIADTWKGGTNHCKLLQEYLAQNGYQVENIIHDFPVDNDMLLIFEKQYEKLQQDIKTGKLSKVLRDLDLPSSQITFDYGLLKSEYGILKKMPVSINYFNDQTVSYAIGSIGNTWKGDEAPSRLISEYLINNNYQIIGIKKEVPVDNQMIQFLKEHYEQLQKDINNGILAQLLHDKGMTGGQITFDYGLIQSKLGIIEKFPITINY